MIRHASVYDPPVEPAEAGFRVLIMRRWPRGIKRERIDLWLKDAAPSIELLRAFQHGDLAWVDFERRYRAEMLHDRPHVLHQLRDLERAHGVVTVYCHERIPPLAHCHRLILADLVSDVAPRASQRDPAHPAD